MLLDKEILLSDAQGVTTTAPSTNSFNAGIVHGRPVYLNVRVDETVTATAAATVTISLETDESPAFASPVTLLSSGAIGKAVLIQGYDVFAVPIPPNVKRYSRIVYTVANGPLTAGKFTAALVDSRPR